MANQCLCPSKHRDLSQCEPQPKCICKSPEKRVESCQYRNHSGYERLKFIAERGCAPMPDARVQTGLEPGDREKKVLVAKTDPDQEQLPKSVSTEEAKFDSYYNLFKNKDSLTPHQISDRLTQSGKDDYVYMIVALATLLNEARRTR